MKPSISIVGFEEGYSNQIHELLLRSDSASSINAVSSIERENSTDCMFADIAIINGYNHVYTNWLRKHVRKTACKPPASLVISNKSSSSLFSPDERRFAQRLQINKHELTSDKLTVALQSLLQAKRLPTINLDDAQAILPSGNRGYREESLFVKTNPSIIFNTASTPSQDEWEKETYIDKFRLTQLLGKGGMGTVYQAQTPSNESVAIKLIDSEKNSGLRLLDRFIDEYELLSKVDHPHVIQVHDQGFTDTHTYIVMELLTNESLQAKILKGLSVEDTIRISIDICHALATIHDLGILHRDIKPINILFDENSRPVLTDFGIAKIAGQPDNIDLTPHGKALGTPAYMSPEQALGKEVTAKTDLYAFGVMMYQMLTGQMPFKANTPAGMMRQHVEAAPPHLPHDLIDIDPIVQRLLHKQEKMRYESAWELHSELEKFVM